MFRHISLRDFVTIVSADLAIPETELYDDDFLRVAKVALDEPAGRSQDHRGVRGRERYTTMPLKHAALVSKLLLAPPIPEYAARVAKATGDEMLRRGRARWTGHPARTLLLFEQWARNPEQIDLKALARGVGPAGGRRGSPQDDALFDDRRADEIGVYLAGPLRALLNSGASDVITAVHEGCERALAQLSRRLGGTVRFSLIHPSHDDAVPEDDAMWEWDLGLLEESAGVLVVADLGRHPISFGVACEIVRFRQLPGALAHLRGADCDGHSSYLGGLTREVAMDQVSCRGPQEIPRRMVAWLSSNLPVLLDAARRRDDAVVLATPSHRRLTRRWERLGRAQRDAIRDAADLSPARMNRVLERPSAFAALPHHSASRLAELVIDDAGHRSPWHDPVHVDNLLAAAMDGHWPPDHTNAVLTESRRRASDLRAAATRTDQSVAFYQRVHRDLYGG